MTNFLEAAVARQGGAIAAILMAASLALIVGVFRDSNRLRRSVYLLVLFALMFAELMLIMSLQLGSIPNLLLMLWVVGHFWLLGRFDR